VSPQFPITAIREIKILKKLHHQNVIKLKEIVTSPGGYNHKQNELDVYMPTGFLSFCPLG